MFVACAPIYNLSGHDYLKIYRKIPFEWLLIGYFCIIWRRGRDSNPRYVLAYARFPSVCLRPLNHLSKCECSTKIALPNKDIEKKNFCQLFYADFKRKCAKGEKLPQSAFLIIDYK